MIQEITEEEFREFCEDCHTPEFYKVLKEVSNTPIYLRRYLELIGRKNCVEELKKENKKLLQIQINKKIKEINSRITKPKHLV